MRRALEILVLVGVVACQYRVLEHPSDRNVYYYDINDNGVVDKGDQRFEAPKKGDPIPIIVRKKQKVENVAGPVQMVNGGTAPLPSNDVPSAVASPARIPTTSASVPTAVPSVSAPNPSSGSSSPQPIPPAPKIDPQPPMPFSMPSQQNALSLESYMPSFNYIQKEVKEVPRHIVLFIQQRYPDLKSAKVISYSTMTGYGTRYFLVFETATKFYKFWIWEDPESKQLDVSNYEETKKNFVFPNRPSLFPPKC